MIVYFKTSGGYPDSQSLIGKTCTAYSPLDEEVSDILRNMYRIDPQEAFDQDLVFVKGSDMKSLGAFPEADDDAVYSFMTPFEAMVVG